MSHYDADFYAGHMDGAVRSARVLAPRLQEFFQPRSVVDVGCGSGALLAEFQRLGVSDILGVDGDYALDCGLLVPRSCFRPADLSRPLKLDRIFDMVLSTEVAEHLPESSAATFVESLVGLGDVVVFSASIPGQFGRNHINEQWPTYWARLFARHGLAVFDGFRQQIWECNEVSWWYRQNLLVFMRPEVSQRFPKFLQLASSVSGAPLDVAHPVFMAHFTNTIRESNSLRSIGRSFLRLLLKRTGLRRNRS